MKTFAMFGIALFVAAGAQAQTTLILPTSSVTFTASADHNATSPLTGQPKVSDYTIQYCLAATPTTCPITVDLGKPTPDSTNTITVATGLWGSIAKDTKYVAVVIVSGPDGSSSSTASLPFGMPAPPAPTPPPVIKR